MNGVRGSEGAPGREWGQRKEQEHGFQHTLPFLLMHVKAFPLFVRTQIDAVTPTSPSPIRTSLSLKDEAFAHSQAAGKGSGGTGTTVVGSPTGTESSEKLGRSRGRLWSVQPSGPGTESALNAL